MKWQQENTVLLDGVLFLLYLGAYFDKNAQGGKFPISGGCITRKGVHFLYAGGAFRP
jgi:hypothetical protein